MPSYVARSGRRPFAFIRTLLSVLAASYSQAVRFPPGTASIPASSAAQREAPLSSAGRTLTRTELRTVRASSAYELVFWLRPEFLQTVLGSAGARVLPSVYINRSDAGPLPVLSDIPASIVEKIQYLTPATAVTRHGPRHRGGIIVVHTLR